MSITSRATKVSSGLKKIFKRIRSFLPINLFWGRHLSNIPGPALVFFPCRDNILFCGIAGLVTFKSTHTSASPDIGYLERSVKKITQFGFKAFQKDQRSYAEAHFGGKQLLHSFKQRTQALKQDDLFEAIYRNASIQRKLGDISLLLDRILASEYKKLEAAMGH